MSMSCVLVADRKRNSGFPIPLLNHHLSLGDYSFPHRNSKINCSSKYEDILQNKDKKKLFDTEDHKNTTQHSKIKAKQKEKRKNSKKAICFKVL